MHNQSIERFKLLTNMQQKGPWPGNLLKCPCSWATQIQDTGTHIDRWAGSSMSASFSPANDDKFFMGIMSASDLKRVGQAEYREKNIV